MKDYAIFSLRLANILANKGFEIVGTGLNFNNPKYKVYYFKNTEELREAVKEYKSLV